MGSDGVDSFGAGIGAEESKMDEDVSAKVSDTTGTGNETIQKSFQGDYLDEAPSALTSEGKSDKAKDDAEKDNITSEEVWLHYQDISRYTMFLQLFSLY